MGEIRYSVVIPVFRGERTLGELCDRLVATLSKLEGGFEIIFVDDGSRDKSWQQICEMAAREPRVLGLHLTRNFGQHNATLCGIRHARGELILTLDEDYWWIAVLRPILAIELARAGNSTRAMIEAEITIESRMPATGGKITQCSNVFGIIN